MKLSLFALVLVFTLMAAVSAEESAELTGYLERMQMIEEAIGQGNDARAMDLVCVIPPFSARQEAISALGSKRVMGFEGACVDLQRKRYKEVFSPPDSLDHFFARRGSSWESFGFIGSSFGSMYSSEGVEIYGIADRDSPGYMTRLRDGSPQISIDLDLDGTPEVTYDGGEPEIADGLAVTIDRAPDGRRVQWFIAPSGIDARANPHIWLYKDGSAYFALVDVNGAGENVMGRSWVTSKD
jgi:hypothetical protein